MSYSAVAYLFPHLSDSSHYTTNSDSIPTINFSVRFLRINKGFVLIMCARARVSVLMVGSCIRILNFQTSSRICQKNDWGLPFSSLRQPTAFRLLFGCRRQQAAALTVHSPPQCGLCRDSYQLVSTCSWCKKKKKKKKKKAALSGFWFTSVTAFFP